MIIKELYENSIQHEAIYLAYYLYSLQQQRKTSLKNDISPLNTIVANEEEIAKLIEDPLRIYKMRVFSLDNSESETYFIFANNEQEALQLYYNTYIDTSKNCEDELYELEQIRIKKVIMMQELKKERSRFPVLVGWCKRAEEKEIART